MGHAVKASLLAHPGHVLLQTDFKTMFKLLCLASMLRAVRKRAPGLDKFCSSMYWKHSELLVRGAAPHTFSYRLGCPRVTQRGMCFGLTVQEVLETPPELFPELRLIVYAYDVYLQGSGEQVIAAYKGLVELSSGIGLQVQPTKCIAYCTKSEAALAVAEKLGVRFAPSEEGIMVAGMPVGSDAKQHADEVADKTVRNEDTLLELPVSARNTFLLLRKSLQLRPNLPRCVVWEQVDLAMQRVPTNIKNAACDILDIDIGEDPTACTVTSQMLMPHKCGGLRVSSHTESTSRSAYLSAAALTEKALQKRNPAFSGPSGRLSQDTYAALRAAHNGLPALSLDAVVNDTPGLRTQVRRAQDEVMLQTLKAMFRNSATLSQQQGASGASRTLPGCTVS